MNEIKIILFDEISKGATIFEGFQGVGLVGTLSAQYLADRTKAKLIGHIHSSELPPMALLVNGELKHPIRIYSFSKGKKNYIIFESELPMPTQLANEVAAKIAEFAVKINAEEIVSFEGIAVQTPPGQSNVFGISNMEKGKNRFSKFVKLLNNGIVIGVAAALLVQAKVYKIPAYCLMAEAHADYPDGLAAAAIIEKLNDIYGFDVDVEALKKESKAFEERLWKVVEQAKEIKDVGGETPKKTYIG